MYLSILFIFYEMKMVPKNIQLNVIRIVCTSIYNARNVILVIEFMKTI